MDIIDCLLYCKSKSISLHVLTSHAKTPVFRRLISVLAPLTRTTGASTMPPFLCSSLAFCLSASRWIPSPHRPTPGVPDSFLGTPSPDPSSLTPSPSVGLTNAFSSLLPLASSSPLGRRFQAPSTQRALSSSLSGNPLLFGQSFFPTGSIPSGPLSTSAVLTPSLSLANFTLGL